MVKGGSYAMEKNMLEIVSYQDSLQQHLLAIFKRL
jgi:hypothetical protein